VPHLTNHAPLEAVAPRASHPILVHVALLKPFKPKTPKPFKPGALLAPLKPSSADLLPPFLPAAEGPALSSPPTAQLHRRVAPGRGADGLPPSSCLPQLAAAVDWRQRHHARPRLLRPG
jgi:hypothetical protein